MGFLDNRSFCAGATGWALSRLPVHCKHPTLWNRQLRRSLPGGCKRLWHLTLSGAMAITRAAYRSASMICA